MPHLEIIHVDVSSLLSIWKKSCPRILPIWWSSLVFILTKLNYSYMVFWVYLCSTKYPMVTCFNGTFISFYTLVPSISTSMAILFKRNHVQLQNMSIGSFLLSITLIRWIFAYLPKLVDAPMNLAWFDLYVMSAPHGHLCSTCRTSSMCLEVTCAWATCSMTIMAYNAILHNLHGYIRSSTYCLLHWLHTLVQCIYVASITCFLTTIYWWLSSLLLNLITKSYLVQPTS